MPIVEMAVSLLTDLLHVPRRDYRVRRSTIRDQ